MEMHLFDEGARVEEALCGADSSASNRMGVDYYMEQRKNGLGVGSVCEGCKALVPPFARIRSLDLEAEGLLDEVEKYREFAARLYRETVRDWRGD